MLQFPDLGASALTFRTASQISDGSPPGPSETCLSFANGPLILVCLVPKGILPEYFDIESALSGSGITTSMVPNVAEHKNRNGYELVAVQSYVELLSTRLQGFTLIADYDPFAPADDVERIHGIAEARKRARDNTFAIAKEAKRRRWTPGSEECYRRVFAKAGLERNFDEEVLNRDIQVSYSQVSCILRQLTITREPTHRLLSSLSSTKAYQ